MSGRKYPRDYPDVACCAECPYVAAGLPGAASAVGSYNCELFNVEWRCCRPNGFVRVCEEEGLIKR